MPNLSPVMTSEPDHAADAIDNLLALDLITKRQARTLHVIAQRQQPMHVEQSAPRHTLHVVVGDDTLRICRKGFVRLR